MVKGKARAAGSFLGGIANNPGIVILGALAIGLFIFRDKISDAFASVGESITGGIGDITLPDITLPEIKFPEFKFPEFKFPDFTFPEIKFPEFKFPDIFGTDIPQPQKMVEDTGLFTPEQLALCKCGSSIVQDAFGNVNQQCKPCKEEKTAAQAEPFRDAAIFAEDFPEEFKELTPVQQFLVTDKGFDIKSFLVDEPLQQFTGGGVSFMGGAVFETPIENLSLSQIIDKFMVTASQAANLKAIAQGFTPEEETFLGGQQDIIGFTGFNPPAVSDPQFQGLTPQQIALILTGGNIQNF